MKELVEFELEMVTGGVDGFSATAGNGSDAQRQRERQRQAAAQAQPQAQNPRNRGQVTMNVQRGPDGGVSAGIGVVFNF